MDRMNLTACRDGSAAMRWSDVVMWSNDSKEQAKIQPNDPDNNSSNTHTQSHDRFVSLFIIVFQCLPFEFLLQRQGFLVAFSQTPK